jgi:hypothetical protein
MLRCPALSLLPSPLAHAAIGINGKENVGRRCTWPRSPEGREHTVDVTGGEPGADALTQACLIQREGG